MENKNVGYLILGISVLIIAIVFIFNNAMKTIVKEGCPAVHQGLVCPAYTTIAQQTYLALAIVGIIVIIGLVLIFSPQKEKIIIRKIKENNHKKEIDLSDLKLEEKSLLKIIQGQKAMFQADLIEKSSLGKVKISRILDKFENRGLIERKRRGLNNLIVLKD
ncbi:MAG: MarR family transcriptional regulator [Nanoarchaeota archaeon]|nr:MarR family transcriptional regulator [Nanoarchaeota archaeon]